jgi:hypothetical protein
VAKSPVNLKGMSRTLDQLTRDLENLQRQPATPARATEAEALHQKLTNVKAMLDSCPDAMFQMFGPPGGPMMAAGARRPAAKKAAKKKARKTAKKTSRKRTRKAR